MCFTPKMFLFPRFTEICKILFIFYTILFCFFIYLQLTKLTNKTKNLTKTYNGIENMQIMTGTGGVRDPRFEYKQMVDNQNIEKEEIKIEPVYIIDDDDDNCEDYDNEYDDDRQASPLNRLTEHADTDSDYFEKHRPYARYTSDSESDTQKLKFQTASGRSTPELSSSSYGGHHRKSVSFDLSGDERSKSDYERYDSEQEYNPSGARLPRKGILRSASPCSSNNSSLEKKRPDKLPPLVPTVARIKEIDSPVLQQVTPRESSPHRIPNSGYRSPPPPPIESVKLPDEIERENPFRDAFLDKNRTDDEYTEIAKAISKSPRSPKDSNYFFGARSGWKSNEDLLQSDRTESGRSTPSTVISQQSKSTENLANRPRKPPPILPKPKVKKADLVQNSALESFQNADMGHGDFTIFEHNAHTNEIHEVSRPNTPGLCTTPSPKLPVRVNMPRSPSRPKDSPPPPPINFATMPKLPPKMQPSLISASHEEPHYMEILPPLPPMPPLLVAPTIDEVPPSQRRPSDFIHENSPDNILVSEDEHRTILLQENEIRNQLRRTGSKSQIPELGVPPDPAPPIPGNSRANYRYLQHLDSITSSKVSTASAITTSHIDPLSPTQIFPTAQILPVQYTNLPQPQQPSAAHVIPAGQPVFTLGGGYVLLPQSVLAQAANIGSGQVIISPPQPHHQVRHQTPELHLHQQRIVISPAETTKLSSSATKVPKSVSDKKRFFESAMEDQHKPTQKSEKVFSFLSKDEVEKLKQEEERKIATLRCDKKKSKLLNDAAAAVANSQIDSKNYEEDDDDDDDDNVDSHVDKDTDDSDSSDDDDNDDDEENEYMDEEDDNDSESDKSGNENAVDMDRQKKQQQQLHYEKNANYNIEVLRETLNDDDAEDISNKIVHPAEATTSTKSTTNTGKQSKLKAPTQTVKGINVGKGEEKSTENSKLKSITNKTTTKQVILKPKATTTTTVATSIPTKAKPKDKKESKSFVRNKSEVTQEPAEGKEKTATTTTTVSSTPVVVVAEEEQQQEVQIKKPSLLPKPKVKVVLPPALLHKQQQHQQEQQQSPAQEHEEKVMEDIVDIRDLETEDTSATSSRIPVRTANAEKRALLAGQPTGDTPPSTPLSSNDTKKSKALINAEKRASWRAARLRSLEKGAVEAQNVIQNMTKITDDLLTETLPSETNSIKK